MIISIIIYNLYRVLGMVGFVHLSYNKKTLTHTGIQAKFSRIRLIYTLQKYIRSSGARETLSLWPMTEGRLSALRLFAGLLRLFRLGGLSRGLSSSHGGGLICGVSGLHALSATTCHISCISISIVGRSWGGAHRHSWSCQPSPSASLCSGQFSARFRHPLLMRICRLLTVYTIY